MQRSVIKNENQLKIDFQRISVLYGNGLLTVCGSLLATFTLFLALNNSLSDSALDQWATISTLSIMPRLVSVCVFFHFQKNRKTTQEDISVWEKVWFYTAIFPATSFAIIPFYEFHSNELVCLLFIGVVIGALCSGAIITATTTLIPALVFINIIILPFIARCFVDSSYYLAVMGLYYICFYCVFSYLAVVSHKVINQNIILHIENKDLSLKDPLTGLWNRRKLYTESDSSLKSHFVKTNTLFTNSIGVVVIDIDFFKNYNDKHGHQAGDEALISVSECIQQAIRKTDLAIRYGGEEFVVIFPNTNLKEMKNTMDRIFTRIEDDSPITISAGIAVLDNDASIEQLINRADNALYGAKENGRNQYIVAA